MKRAMWVIGLGILIAVGGLLVSESLSPHTWLKAAPPGAQELGNQFSKVAKAVSPAVVHIRTTQVVRTQPMPSPFPDHPFFRRFGGPPRGDQPQEFQRKGLGSGVIVTPDGYILTNNHVVRGSSEIIVKLNDRREYKGKVVGTDPPTDLALVKIEAKGLPTAPLGDSDKIEVGHWVLAIGNPFGLDRTVTGGIISAKGRANVGVAAYEDFIQTDAAINPGNSGGPLVNLDGEVIGINTAIASRGGGNVGIGFAIPVNMAKRVMADLRGSKNRVTRAWLGIGMGEVDLTQELARQFGLDRPRGVVVTRVIKDTPADKAGLKEGDIILAIDGREVNGRQQLSLRIAESRPGAEVTLTLWRDKKEMKVKVSLSERTDDVLAKAQDDGSEKGLGLQLQDLTDELSARLGVRGEKGVVVSGLQLGGPAARAGLKVGDLIQKVGPQKVAVTSAAELHAIVAQLGAGESILVLYRRKDVATFTVIRR